MANITTETYKRGEDLGFEKAEVDAFVEAAAKRDSEGRGWNSLFEKDSTHLVLPLLADEEQANGLDAKLQKILDTYNEHQTEGAPTLQRHPKNPKMLQSWQNGKPLSRDQKLISFLEALDDAEALLLAHDLQVEWGKAKAKTPIAEEAESKTLELDLLRQNTPLAADHYATDDLRVVISRDAIDIAGMSTGRRWQSCTGKIDRGGRAGVNFDTLKGEIEAGSLVAYLVHKDDTALRYPLMRVLLKPFKSESTEDAVLVPNSVYGAELQGNSLLRDRLMQTLRDFASNKVNVGKTGSFAMTKGVYPDGQETTLTFGAALQGDALAAAIAKSIPSKIEEYIVEIEAAHQRGAEGTVSLYKKKLGHLYAKPQTAALAYLRNLADMNIGDQLPKPSDVVAAISSKAVRAALADNEILANLYLLSPEGWVAYMQTEHPDLTELNLRWKRIGDVGVAALAQHPTLVSLNLNINNIGDAGATKLAMSKNLAILHLVDNNIGPAGRDALIEGLKQSKNILISDGPCYYDLESHGKQNRAKAYELLNKIRSNEPFSPEEKAELSERANAVRGVLQGHDSLSPEQKAGLAKKIDCLANQKSWAERVSSTPDQVRDFP